jgi:hypothetical protein
MAWTVEEKQILEALNMMAKACGFSGDSGTEALFAVLERAVLSVGDQWDDVVEHRDDGLFEDVNATLALGIAKAASEISYGGHA